MKSFAIIVNSFQLLQSFPSYMFVRVLATSLMAFLFYSFMFHLLFNCATRCRGGEKEELAGEGRIQHEKTSSGVLKNKNCLV